jgi:hypothetical protein
MAPGTNAAASALAGFAPGKPVMAAPEKAADIARSLGTGVRQGAVGLAGLPGDIAEYGARGINWAVQGIGGLTGLDVGPPRAPQAPTYGTADIGCAITRAIGPAYAPQTTAGRYAETVAEFVPAALTGPGGLARRLVLGEALPGVSSEAAGQAAAGTSYEPYARLGGAGAMARGMAARLITPFPSATPAHTAFVQQLRQTGVESTAGQATGAEFLRYAESSLGHLPGAGSRAAAAMESANEQFTAATCVAPAYKAKRGRRRRLSIGHSRASAINSTSWRRPTCCAPIRNSARICARAR